MQSTRVSHLEIINALVLKYYPILYLHGHENYECAVGVDVTVLDIMHNMKLVSTQWIETLLLVGKEIAMSTHAPKLTPPSICV